MHLNDQPPASSVWSPRIIRLKGARCPIRAITRLRFILSPFMALSLTASFALAQGYPNRPTSLYQGFPAGGTADVIARALGDEISKTLGQPVVVEAKPDASGNLATRQVVRSAPDGHSLVLFTTAHLISPALMTSISFDALKDLDYISMIAEFSFFIAVHNDSSRESRGSPQIQHSTTVSPADSPNRPAQHVRSLTASRQLIQCRFSRRSRSHHRPRCRGRTAFHSFGTCRQADGL